MTTFCRRSYGLKENYSSLSIIPEFEGGVGVTTIRLHIIQIKHSHIPYGINGISKAKQIISSVNQVTFR